MKNIHIILLFLIWRLYLFIIAYLSPIFIHQFGGSFPYYQELLMGSKLPHFIWSFANFDGVHYIRIAESAYSYQNTQVFFPFYPLLVKIGSYLIGGNLIISSLLISNGAFLFALLIFFKLIEEKYNKNTAAWSVYFLLAFPTSFFFGSAYTEGFFFLLITGSFYLISKNKILVGSVLGGIASGTKLIGLFLAPSYYFGKNWKNLLPLFVMPLGFLVYAIYLQVKFHNPFYFISAQTIFGQERSTHTIILLPQVIFRYIKILATTQGKLFASALFELTATIFALTSIFIIYKKIPRDWLAFSVFVVVVPTLTGTLVSMPRYIIVAFPIYIALASIKNSVIKKLILIVFLILLFVTTTLFTQGYWVA